MTDISVIKMIISVAAWRIYPSWVNDEVPGVGGTRPLENVLGEAPKGRFSFEARKYLFSFPSYVHFEEFFVSRAFLRFGAKRLSSGVFVSTVRWSSFWKSLSVTRHFFANSDDDHEKFFENIFIFSKQSRCFLPDSYGDPQAEQSTLVIVEN